MNGGRGIPATFEAEAAWPAGWRAKGLAGGTQQQPRGKEASNSKTQECLLTCNRSSQKDGRKLDSKEVKQLTVPCNICRKQRLSLLWLRGAGFVYSSKTQVCWSIHRSGHCQGRIWQKARHQGWCIMQRSAKTVSVAVRQPLFRFSTPRCHPANFVCLVIIVIASLKFKNNSVS